MENRSVWFYDRNYSTARVKTVKGLLLSLFGVGVGSVLQLAASVGLSPSTQLLSLSRSKLAELSAIIDSTMVVGRSLRKQYLTRVSEKKRVGSYQGVRHQQRLPVRGQRTHSNGKTVRRTSF